MNENPYEPTTSPTVPNRASHGLGFYWNSILACVALGFHCITFVAFDFIDDDGATGRALFPLAPLALLIGMFCITVSLVQVVLLLNSFVKHSPVRYHRLAAIAITWIAISLIFVAGSFGWFIHV